jgi:protein AbiQ
LWGVFFDEARMHFYRLTPEFFDTYGLHTEILNKQGRPYYVLILEVDMIVYAIPLRSQISHQYCFLADGTSGGLDFSKAVVITDQQKFVDPKPTMIREQEFLFYRRNRNKFTKKFSAYVRFYKSEVVRHNGNPALPIPPVCIYSTLKYFHKELGLEP